MESLPDYKRPFDQPDFRGYFRWTAKLSRSLGGHVYHACHAEELSQYVTEGELALRSEWQLRLPKHGTWSAPGVWVGLNYFYSGNKYGPCLIEFPIRILNGRSFMVFQRIGTERKRYFFVQYESRIPIFSFGKNLWRTVNPEYYFNKSKGRVTMRAGAIYDIVLTLPLPLTDYTIQAVNHPRCISGKCSGTSTPQSQKIVHLIASAQARQVLTESSEIQDLLQRFPCLEGRKVKLEHASK
jgi:hypothetical protein